MVSKQGGNKAKLWNYYIICLPHLDISVRSVTMFHFKDQACLAYSYINHYGKYKIINVI